MVVLLVSARVGRCQDFRDNLSYNPSEMEGFILFFLLLDILSFYEKTPSAALDWPY